MNTDQVSLGMVEHAFHEYYEGLHRYAYTLTGDHETAKDIVQQVFLTVWENRATIAINGSFRSYLFRSIHNRSINYSTRTRKLEKLDHGIANQATVSSQHPLEINEMKQQLHAAMERLPPQCRTVFLKKREEGKTYAEMAMEMGISIKTVEAHMTKAMKILRQELAPYLFYILFVSTCF